MSVSNRLAASITPVVLLLFVAVLYQPLNAQIVEDTNITLFDNGSAEETNFYSVEIIQGFGTTDFTCMFFATDPIGNGMVRVFFDTVCVDESSQWFAVDFCDELTTQAISNKEVEIWGGFGATGPFQANSFDVSINEPFFVGVNTGIGFDGPMGEANRDAFGWAEWVIDDTGTLTMLDNAFAYDLGGVVIGKNQAAENFTPPSSYTVFRGVELNGSISDYASSDDIAASYRPGFTLGVSEPPVWLIFSAVAPAAAQFRVESSAGTPGLEYTVEAFNWATSSYDIISSRTETFNVDEVAEFPVVAADHIDVNGEVRSRVGWRVVGFTINFPWVVNVDQTGWTQ